MKCYSPALDGLYWEKAYTLSIISIMNIMYKEIIFNVIYQVSDKNLKED